MKTKQKVKLIYLTPLWLISNAIRYSHNNHYKSDTDNILQLYNHSLTEEPDFNDIGVKDFNLIKRIGFNFNHSSVLEHSLIVFNLSLTQKALLEISRHRVGLSMTVTSSRYSLGSMGIKLEQTGNDYFDKKLNEYKKIILDLLDNIGKNQYDKLAELLPQAFIYKGQFTFNIRSLIHFLELRTNKSAHRDIRLLAYMMFKELPDEYKELILSNEKIDKQTKQCEKDFEND